MVDRLSIDPGNDLSHAASIQGLCRRSAAGRVLCSGRNRRRSEPAERSRAPRRRTSDLPRAALTAHGSRSIRTDRSVSGSVRLKRHARVGCSRCGLRQQPAYLRRGSLSTQRWPTAIRGQVPGGCRHHRRSRNHIPDIPIPSIGGATLSVGADRHLCVALPGASDAADSDRDGAVLRFDLTGAAKGLASVASPLITKSNPRPTKLSWNNDQLWLAGLIGSQHVLARMNTHRDSVLHPLRPPVTDARSWLAIASGVRDLSPVPMPADERASSLLLLLERPRKIVRLIVDGSSHRALSMADLDLGSMVPEAVTASRTGDLYIGQPGRKCGERTPSLACCFSGARQPPLTGFVGWEVVGERCPRNEVPRTSTRSSKDY